VIAPADSPAGTARAWARALPRPLLLLPAYLVALPVWSAIASAGGLRLGPPAAVGPPDGAQVAGALGSSLALLLPALLLGVAGRFGVAGLAALVDGASRAEPWIGAAARALAWIAQLPWTALSAFVLAAFVLAAFLVLHLAPQGGAFPSGPASLAPRPSSCSP
jgi:hypothetical protein